MISELKARKNVPVKLWIPAHEVESGALDQLKNVADLPQVFSHVAAMPDCHFGMGATIGTVIAMKDAVIPAAVGVDIGCGMEAIRTNLVADELDKKHLEILRDGILDRIPVGFNSRESVHKLVKGCDLFRDFSNLHPDVQEFKDRAMAQLGTLGGGNHFIEISVDEDDQVWVMLHSGSRYIGNAIAKVHIRIAKEQEFNTGLSDRALSTLSKADSPSEYEQYMHDLKWAQDYASENRKCMLLLISEYLKHTFLGFGHFEHISCHHNFAQPEEHMGENLVITRKGAIQADVDQWGIIPGAMGAKSFIVQGKGCKEAFKSAPHGAGRRMSRSKAKKSYDFKDLEKTMDGIVCNASKNTVDEIKFSYKDIDDVMKYAGELVTPKYELHQLLNIKG